MLVHATNIKGAGAVTLLASLLPALISQHKFKIEKLWLPDNGFGLDSGFLKNVTVNRYKRYFPNGLSRVLECTLFSRQFDGSGPIIVLGDLPLRLNCFQTLFVQSPHLIPEKNFFVRFRYFKYVISRMIFRLNLQFVDAFIVQTEVMRSSLEDAYPSIKGRIYVVPQPVPDWLLSANLKRVGRVSSANKDLNLIYPAAFYPHKNHKLLLKIGSKSNWPIKNLQLTIKRVSGFTPNVAWLSFRGFLLPEEMISAYSHVDAILFLSKNESYGFPLVEAMSVGLPIICPDLPYAHFLCGDEAIYFDPDSVVSLKIAVGELAVRLQKGWWPNWTKQLKFIPSDWETVANQMLSIASDGISVVAKPK